MKVVTPKSTSGEAYVIAKDQPEYESLPARITEIEFFDHLGKKHSAPGVITEWELSPHEAEVLRNGGRIRMHTITFGQPFSPVIMEVIE